MQLLIMIGLHLNVLCPLRQHDTLHTSYHTSPLLPPNERLFRGSQVLLFVPLFWTFCTYIFTCIECNGAGEEIHG